MNRDLLTRLLQLDGAANIAAGIALVVGAGALTVAIGVDAFPIRVAGLVLAGYGVNITPRGLVGLVVVDLTFAVLALGVAVVDPTTAEPWTRWAVAIVADLSAIMGLLKIAGLRRVVATTEA